MEIRHLVMIIIVLMISYPQLYAQEWNPNPATVSDDLDRDGTVTLNKSSTDPKISTIFIPSFQPKLRFLVVGGDINGLSGNESGNIGHLQSGRFGLQGFASGDNDQWMSIGIGGSSLQNQTYGQRFQFNRYSISMGIADDDNPLNADQAFVAFSDNGDTGEGIPTSAGSLVLGQAENSDGTVSPRITLHSNTEGDGGGVILLLEVA